MMLSLWGGGKKREKKREEKNVGEGLDGSSRNWNGGGGNQEEGCAGAQRSVIVVCSVDLLCESGVKRQVAALLKIASVLIPSSSSSVQVVKYR